MENPEQIVTTKKLISAPSGQTPQAAPQPVSARLDPNEVDTATGRVRTQEDADTRKANQAPISSAQIRDNNNRAKTDGVGKTPKEVNILRQNNRIDSQERANVMRDMQKITDSGDAQYKQAMATGNDPRTRQTNEFTTNMSNGQLAAAGIKAKDLNSDTSNIGSSQEQRTGNGVGSIIEERARQKGMAPPVSAAIKSVQKEEDIPTLFNTNNPDGTSNYGIRRGNSVQYMNDKGRMSSPIEAKNVSGDPNARLSGAPRLTSKLPPEYNLPSTPEAIAANNAKKQISAPVTQTSNKPVTVNKTEDKQAIAAPSKKTGAVMQDNIGVRKAFEYQDPTSMKLVKSEDERVAAGRANKQNAINNYKKKYGKAPTQAQMKQAIAKGMA